MGLLEAIGIGNPEAALGSAIIGGFLGSEGQQDTNATQVALSQQQMDFQREMSNTSYQRAVTDMRKAGLNPMLAYHQGGASTPSGSQPPTLGNPAAAGSSAAAAAAQTANVIATTDRTEAEAENVRMDTSLKAVQMQHQASSAAQLNALTEQLRQQIQAWVDFGESHKVSEYRQQRERESLTRMERQERERNFEAHVAGQKALADALVTKARLLGLEVPGALNQAAFENSVLGQYSRPTDFVVRNAGRIVNSAGSLVGLTRGIPVKIEESKPVGAQEHKGSITTSGTIRRSK